MGVGSNVVVIKVDEVHSEDWESSGDMRPALWKRFGHSGVLPDLPCALRTPALGNKTAVSSATFSADQWASSMASL